MYKRVLISFLGKIGTIVPDFPGKMTVFSSFDPTFPPVLAQNLALPSTQNYLFDIGLFPKKFQNVIFKIMNLVAI